MDEKSLFQIKDNKYILSICEKLKEILIHPIDLILQKILHRECTQLRKVGFYFVSFKILCVITLLKLDEI